jgi:hypothetical protein
MPDVTQMLRRGGTPDGQRNLVAGYVSNQKPAPTHFTDQLWVVLPDFSPDFSQPVRWAQLHGAQFPAQGAAVLVAFDDQAQPHAVWWDAGAYAKPSVTGSRGGNAALASLLTALAAAGLITDNTTA